MRAFLPITPKETRELLKQYASATEPEGYDRQWVLRLDCERVACWLNEHKFGVSDNFGIDMLQLKKELL